MFRLHRHKSDKSGEKIDFKLSHFQASKVPKGWDKLIVSMISVETGKTVAKLNKALVRSGNCQWTESLSESIWISQDGASKEIENSLYKLVISMGSVRSGILGEATINLITYKNSRTSVPVSLPLKKCSHGTILQVKIQCLNPRKAVGDEQRQEPASHLEDTNANNDEMDNKSDVSDNSYSRSIGSSSSINLGSNSLPGELGSRNTSFSASGSHRSSDSAEGSIDRTNFSPRNNNLNGDLYSPVARQDSTGLQNGAPNGVGPVEDHSRSNQSSFNSRFTGSGNNYQNLRQELGHNSSQLLGTSALKNVSSSKDLLEAAEDTIEDLRAEAKMWERNARKLMLDLEVVRKEFTDQSRHQADLTMELSAAFTERDGLKQEITQLTELLEESKGKQTAAEKSISQAEGVNHIQKELEGEIRFQKDSNANLALQLQKTQEANIELLSILEELEDTVEKQRVEIETILAGKTELAAAENSGHGNEDAKGPMAMAEETFNLEIKLQELQESHKELQATVHLLEKTVDDKTKEVEFERDLRHQTLVQLEVEWKSKLSKKEEEITQLEAKLSGSPSAQFSDEAFADGGHSNLIKEIESLREKVQELENDCSELTEENLDLVFKLKESKKDLLTGGSSFNSSLTELQANVSATASDSELDCLGSQLYQLKEESRKKEAHSEGGTTDHLQVQLINLQNRITDLELQLQSSRDKASDLDFQLHRSQAEIKGREMEVFSLKQQLESYQGKETNKENQLTVVSTSHEKFESQSSVKISEQFVEVHKQLQMAIAHVKRPWYNEPSHISTQWEVGHYDLVDSDGTVMTLEEQAGVILCNFSELNKLFEAKISECETVFQRNEVELIERDADVIEAQKKLEDYSLKENSLRCSNQELESLGMELEAKVANLSKELVVKRSAVEDLETNLSLKEEEIEVLRRSQTELNVQITDLLKEKGQLEENLEIVSRESSITSKCLDDVRNDLMVLSSSLDSHVSANKTLERKLSELESVKHELELNVSELEEENVKLSERISGLEAQLRYLTDEKESSRLELANSKSLARDLRNEIERMVVEMETQKVDLKQKLQDMQKRWSEAQEECEYLKRANPKLQATAENLIEEYTSVQKLNGELRKQKLELHERCTHLEAELRKSRTSFSDCCKKVEHLESKFSSMQEDVASKEKLLTSELDVLLNENMEHKQKLVVEESLLSQMYSEMTTEAEDLQREVAHLTEQISSTPDQRERIASNAVLKASTLRADKAKLESGLQEAQAKVKFSDTALQSLQLESGSKVEGLISDLAAYRQNQELLMVDHEKLQKLLDEVKQSEDRYKSTVDGLELKLTVSEYERQQLAEEIMTLKVQLQKVALLQDEIVTLKSTLNEVKFEKGKLEVSLQMLSGDCEELKAERASFVEKISNLQKSVCEFEDCKRSKIMLEEKVLRLEGDLNAKEALFAQDAELKNELSRIKRANSQYQRKIQSLEDEKDEWQKKSQAFEEELKLKKEELKRDNEHDDDNGSPQLTRVDLLSKIEMLEIELAEAVEANNMYKMQLKKLLTEREVGSNAEWETKALLVEAELKDLRERYFHMSLKFAEVEAEREELVMKFKSLRSGKRWFGL